MKTIVLIVSILVGIKLPTHVLTEISKISVECINGGAKGYNSVSLKCDEESGVYTLKCENPGYEKANLCPAVYVEIEIKDILTKILEKINTNNPIEESYLSGHYNVVIKSTNMYNYSYQVSSSK